MEPCRDQTSNPWICSQTHICSQTLHCPTWPGIQIRPDNTSSLIWIQTIPHFDGTPELFFFRKDKYFEKKTAEKKHKNYSVGKELRIFQVGKELRDIPEKKTF